MCSLCLIVDVFDLKNLPSENKTNTRPKFLSLSYVNPNSCNKAKIPTK